MAITKNPARTKPAFIAKPLPHTKPLSSTEAPIGDQMAEALQKFIDAAPDGVPAKRAVAPDSVKLSLRIRLDELAGLDQAARRQGLTRSAFIKRAVLLQRAAELDAELEASRRGPVADEAPGEAGKRLRQHLMKTLSAHLRRTKMSQAQAAKLCGVTQPRISEVMRGQGDIGLEALVNMASAAGLQVDLRVLAEV